MFHALRRAAGRRVDDCDHQDAQGASGIHRRAAGGRVANGAANAPRQRSHEGTLATRILCCITYSTTELTFSKLQLMHG
eukprot:2989875-Pleurochrysis_carterae.AAC.1